MKSDITSCLVNIFFTCSTLIMIYSINGQRHFYDMVRFNGIKIIFRFAAIFSIICRTQVVFDMSISNFTCSWMRHVLNTWYISQNGLNHAMIIEKNDFIVHDTNTQKCITLLLLCSMQLILLRVMLSCISADPLLSSSFIFSLSSSVVSWLMSFLCTTDASQSRYVVILAFICIKHLILNNLTHSVLHVHTHLAKGIN